MYGFPWPSETNSVETEDGVIRSTSRSSHFYDFQDVSNNEGETYRVLDIGSGGAEYMEEISERLYEEGIEDHQIIGVDLNEELFRKMEMSSQQLFADGLRKTTDKSWERAQKGDYPRAIYDAGRGVYNTIKESVDNEANLPDEAELVVADAEELPFENSSFDLVVSQFLIGYDEIIDSERIRSEAERVARPEADVWFYSE
jgi:hypothetical protein